MKKFLLMLFSISIIVMLGACSSKDEAGDNTNGQDKQVATELPFEYDKKENGEIVIKKYVGNEENVKIPDTMEGASVTEIKEYAFEKAPFVEDITIPNTVSVIGKEAFTGTVWYENLDYGTIVGDGVLVKIDKSAEELTIEKEVKCIMEGILTDSSIRKLIILSCELWQDNLFQNRSTIEEVVLVEGITEINSGMFWNCKALKIINFPETIKIINKSAFSSCESLESVQLNEGVTDIGEDAFNACKSLKSVNFPQSLKNLGSRAFSGCASLESVEVQGNISVLKEYVFKECKRLSSVKLTDAITNIEAYAFANCEALKEINIPSSITIIDNFAFLGCNNIENVKLDGIKEIDFSLFEGTPFYNNAVINSGDYIIIGDGILVGYKGTSEHMNIPSSVKSISQIYLFSNDDGGFNDSDGDGTFSKSILIKKITIPTSVTYIGEMAFGSYGHYYVEKIVIPGNVKTIASGAFCEVLDVKEICIEEGVEEIYTGVFYDQRDIQSVSLPTTLKYLDKDWLSMSSTEKIIGVKGTLAEEYAIERNIVFEEK